MALSDYDKQKLSAQQQAQIQDLTNKWNELDAQYKQAQQNGDTALADSLKQQKTDVHNQAQVIRASAGYSGGADGSQNLSLNGGSDYRSENAKTYGGLNDSAVVNTYKDGNGNTIKEFSEEAVKSANEKHNATVQDYNAYVNANPSAVTYLLGNERQVDTSKAGTNGRYTYDEKEMSDAMRAGYKVYQRKDADGNIMYYISDTTRTTPEGASGADEAHLSDQDYAYVQFLKADYAENQQLYQQAVKAGDTALAAQYKAKMEQDHLEAERIRSAYGYAGGTDGSAYIDFRVEAAKGNMPAYTDSVQRFLDVKGIDYTLPSWKQSEHSHESSGNNSGSAAGSNSSSLTGGSDSLLNGTLSAPTLSGITSAPSLNGTPSTPAPSDTLPAPTLSDSGVTASPTFKVNDYSQYIQDMYDAKREAAIAALDAAYQQNINSINRAGEGIAETYQNARNQTAGASELAKRNFAQYAAANGLNSGTGGQAELARNVTLQNNLNSINNAESQSIADLELQRANAEAEYNNAIAQAEATGNYELANALYQEKVRYETALNNAIQQEFQNAITNYQLQYQEYRDKVGDNQWERAFAQQVAQQDWENLFNQTQYNNSLTQQDFENAFLLQQYQNSLEQQNWQNNFNQTQYDNNLTQQNFQNAFLLQQYWDSLEQQNFENALNANKPSLTYSQVMSAIESGVVTPTVKSAFEYYNGVPYDTYYGGGTGVGTTPTGTTLTTQGYDNGTLTSVQVKEMQAYYGLTADGFWGPNSQSVTGMSADEAWARYQLKKNSNEPLKITQATDGQLNNTTLAWSRKVLDAHNNDVNYLINALIARSFSQEDINAILLALGLN